MIITWLFDKLGYMPKITVDSAWSFPVENTIKKSSIKKPAAKKTVAKKTVKKKA